MIFTDPLFLLFFGLVFVVHWSLPSQGWRRGWLLACSYFFYACWDWRFLSLLLVSTIVDWVVALRIDASDDARVRKRWLVLSLTTNLGLLGVFKYLGFFVESATQGLAALGIAVHVPTLDIVLPVGISFYTFQTMSYTLDVYAGRLAARRNLAEIAHFVAFFPQLVAGPIVRARDFLPQAETKLAFSQIAFRASLSLFAVGFFKKAVVSNALAPLVDAFYAVPDAFDVASAWTALGLYAAQFYCDFSGYSDMAIGLAGLLGYSLRENFRFPYLAPNIQEFWRRWHISLGSWITDYFWKPLLGPRAGRLRVAVVTLLAMLLIGLWHGAAWTFVLLGVVHGVALVVHRSWAAWRRGASPAFPGSWIVAVLVTDVFVWLTMILFRAPDMATVGAILALATGQRPAGDVSLGLTPVVLLALLAVVHVLAWSGGVPRRLARAPDWTFAVAYGALAAALLAFASGATDPFIYFQF